MGETVELATILLTDLVGSTRLAMSVGPARADELREEHFGLLRDAVSSCGGTEVKNTGDGLMVAFASASAAVRCAVAMQQSFERRYRNAEQGLHIRVGLGAGESTVKEDDYFGMPTVEAARLCDQAPSDGILVSATVKMLAGRCDGVGFESIGELALKGFSEPVEAFAVSWAPLAEEAEGTSRWPLPALLRAVPPVSYVGRNEERAALESAMTLARAGRRQLLLLSGEPGIGKTRLASFAAHRAHATGMVVSWGACSEELAVPYEPWIEVCTQLVEHAPLGLLERHVARHGGELRRMARNLARRLPELPEPQSSDPETERYLLFSAVVGLVAEVTETVPVCLVLDDLQWADGESVALLKHLVRSFEQGALQVLATYRDSDLGKDHPLGAVLADLRMIDGVQRIALHGLGPAEVTELMTVVAGHELDEDGVELAGQIAAETEGNPFFVGEILRSLSESGTLIFDEASGRWTGASSAAIVLPESVREVIERRVERLGRVAETLTMAAVIGRTFEVELLAMALGRGESELLDDLEAAVAASVLAESTEQIGQFRFAHALINQTLYEALGTTRRARMHHAVAEALEDLCGADPVERLAELALHWRLAALSVDKRKAGEYARRAGDRALQSLAPAEAVRLFGDAVELSRETEGVEYCQALIGLGEAQRQSGHAAYRETLLEASEVAGRLRDAELASQAALFNNRGIWGVIGEIDQERLSAIERAIELDRPPEPARRARLLALQAQELGWDPDFARRRELADEAIALARQAGDPRTLAEVLRSAFLASWSAETLTERTLLSKEVSKLVLAAGDPALQLWAHDLELHVAIERGELDAVDGAVGRLNSLASEIAQPSLRWFAMFTTAAWRFMLGDLPAAEELSEQAFQIGQEAGQPDAVLVYGGQLALTRVYQDRAIEIIDMLQQSVSMYPAIAAWRAGLAMTLAWLDHREEAAAMLEAAARDRFDHIRPEVAKLTALSFYADAAWQTRSREAAAILHELLEPWAGQVVWNAVVGCGHARMWLGLLDAVLGEDERADEELSFACEFQELNGLNLWAARGRLGWAEALASRGDAPRAAEEASRALALATSGGYQMLQRRASALMASPAAR